MLRWSLPWMCALGLGACAAVPESGASRSASPASLAGTRWAGIVDAATDSRLAPRLEFAHDRVSGFTGCNTLSGSWRMEGAEARFGAIATTRRLCIGAAGEIEKRLLAAVGEGSRARRDGARLTVVGPAGDRFEFTELPA